MARIRTAKPEWYNSPKWARWPRDLRSTYKGIWEKVCDDEGRFVADARLVKGELWALDDDLAADVIEGWLRQMTAIPVTMEDGTRSTALVFYEVDGVRYGLVTNFLKHQRVSHPTPSKLPPPPADSGARLNYFTDRVAPKPEPSTQRPATQRPARDGGAGGGDEASAPPDPPRRPPRPRRPRETLPKDSGAAPEKLGNDRDREGEGKGKRSRTGAGEGSGEGTTANAVVVVRPPSAASARAARAPQYPATAAAIGEAPRRAFLEAVTSRAKDKPARLRAAHAFLAATERHLVALAAGGATPGAIERVLATAATEYATALDTGAERTPTVKRWEAFLERSLRELTSPTHGPASGNGTGRKSAGEASWEAGAAALAPLAGAGSRGGR